jgi:hypothetical protein
MTLGAQEESQEDYKKDLKAMRLMSILVECEKIKQLRVKFAT